MTSGYHSADGYAPVNKQQQQQQASPLQQQQQPLQSTDYADGWQKPAIPVEGEPLYGSDAPPELSRFRVNGYKDPVFLFLFVAHLLAIFIVGCINFHKGLDVRSDANTNTNVNVNVNTKSAEHVAAVFGKACAAALGVAIVLSVVSLLLMRQFPAAFIWMANIFVVLIFVAYAIFGFAIGSTFLGVVGIIFAVIMCLWLWCVKNRIPFSALLLEVSVDKVFMFPATVAFSFVMLAFAAVYFVFWTATTVPTMDKLFNSEAYSADAGTGAGAYVVYLLLLLCMFWAITTAQNVCGVTTAGCVATWYFSPDALPPNPTLASAKRALGPSLGSIAFGSLIIAIIKLIRALARSAYRQNRNSIGACIALCVISCIERIMVFFNQYAMAMIAIYGQSFVDSAKLAWDFMTHSLWAAVINEILIDRVFVLLILVIAAADGALCYWFFHHTGHQWVALAAGVIVALVVSNIVFHTVHSGIIALMVCVSNEPEVFAMKHQPLHAKMTEAINAMKKGPCDSSDS